MKKIAVNKDKVGLNEGDIFELGTSKMTTKTNWEMTLEEYLYIYGDQGYNKYDYLAEVDLALERRRPVSDSIINSCNEIISSIKKTNPHFILRNGISKIIRRK